MWFKSDSLFPSALLGRTAGILGTVLMLAGAVGCGFSGDTGTSSLKSLLSGNSTASQSAGQDSSQRPDPATHMLSMLTEKLGLSTEQQAQVQTILQEQQAAIKALHDSNASAAQAAFQAMQAAQQSGDQAAIQAAQEQMKSLMEQDKAIMDAADQKIRALLTTDQQTLFDQMLAEREQMMQNGGPGGHGGPGGPGDVFMSSDNPLNLTDDQKAQIQQIFAAAHSQATPGTPPDQAAMEAVRQQVDAVLTADQLAKLQELTANAPAPQ